MKKVLLGLFLFSITHVVSFAQNTWVTSGCNGTSPTVSMVLINACGTEGYTEYFTANTGSAGFNVNTLSLQASTGVAGSPVSANNFSGANAASIIASLNSWTGCGNVFVPVPANGIIPPNSAFWIFPSSQGVTTITPIPDLSGYCGQTIYIASGDYNTTFGFYGNNQSNNPAIINMGGCTLTINYTGMPGGDGANITNAGAGVAMLNGGGQCFPPPPVLCTPPTASATANGPVCLGGIQNINLGVTTNGVGATYNWAGTGITAANQNQQNPTILNAGLNTNTTYQVTVTVPGGCTATSSVLVSVLTAPTIISPVDLTVCSGLVTPLTGQLSPPSGTATYTWSGPGLSSTSGQNITATANPAGTWPNTTISNYSVTATDGGCSTVKAFKITTVQAPPAPNITVQTSACAGQTINLTTSSINTGLPFPPSTTLLPIPVQFNWTSNNGFSSSTTAGPGALPYTVTTSAPSGVSSVTYTLVLSSSIAAGCNTAPITATVNITPPIVFSSKTVCAGGTIDLTTVFPAGQVAGTWSGTGVSGNTFNATGLNGIYNISFTPSGSTCVSQLQITVNPAPTINTSQTGIICGGPPYTGTVTLTVDPGSTTYLWSAGVTGSGNSVTVSTPGTYMVTVTTASGCMIVKTYNVPATPNPTPTINGVSTLCAGGNSTLTVSPTGFSTYSWQKNGVAAGNSATLNIVGPTQAQGSDTYTLTVTNGTCSATATKIVSTNAGLTPTLAGNPFVCGTNGSTIMSISNVPAFTSYTWTNSTPATISTTSSVTITSTGNYIVTVTDANNCSGSLSFSIQQFTTPTVTISGVLQACPNGGATTLNTVPNTFVLYKWNYLNATTATINPPVGGPYTVTVTDNNGCTATDTKSVTAYTAPVPIIAGSTTICAGSSTTLDAGSGYNSYLWSNNGGAKQTATFSAQGTYTVTVTDGKGCSGTALVNVTTSASLNITISGKDNFCKGGKTKLNAGAGFTTYKWSYNNATTQEIDVDKAGTYTVTVTNGPCSGTASIIVKENNLPTVTIIGDSVICQGVKGVLKTDKTFASYAWSNSETTQSIDFQNAGTYKVTVTDANGCNSYDDITPEINALPMPKILGKKAFCEGDTISLSVATGFSSYNWSNNDKTSKIKVSAEGTYKVTVTLAKCAGFDSIFIKKNTKPTLVLSKDTTVCDGQEVIFVANGGTANYAWSSSEKIPSISKNKSGTYKVTVTNADGCFVIDSVKLKVNPTPKPIIDVPSTICVGETAIFKLTEKYDKYLWSNSATTDTIHVKDTQLYAVTVTSKDGCSATTSKSVSIKSGLVPSIIGKTKFCEGEAIILRLDATYATYLWSDQSKGDSLKVTDTGQYAVSVATASGCKGVAVLNVTKVPNPTPNILGNLIVCAGKGTTLTLNNPFTKYEWTGGKTTSSLAVDKAGIYKVIVTNADGCKGETSVNVTENQVSGNFKDTLCKNDFVLINKVKYDFTNPSGKEIIKVTGGCDSTVNIQLYFRDEISVNFESVSAICKGQSADLIVKANGFSGTFDLIYEDSNGKSFTEKNVQNGDKIKVSPLATTTYTIKNVTIPNGKCAINLGNTKITINEVKLSIVASNYNGYGVSCGGSDDGFATATASQGTSPIKYEWSSGFTGNKIDRLKAGKYIVTATDAIGCIATDTVLIKESEKVSLIFTPKNPLCASNPKGSILLSDVKGGSGSYLYSTDDKNFTSFASTSATINGLSPNEYNVTVKDNNGCSVSQKIKIEAGSFIKVDLGEDKTITFGDSVVITPSADFQMKSIQWTNAKYLSCPNCQFPVAKPIVTTGFKVTVFDENGCSASDDILIFVKTPRNVYVPSVFSPNLDGTNDYFKPFLGEGVLKVNFFRVYDRWGNIVYEDFNFTRAQSQDATRGWDGMFRGQFVNPAVFTFSTEVEFIDGEKKIYKGDVTVSRE